MTTFDDEKAEYTRLVAQLRRKDKVAAETLLIAAFLRLVTVGVFWLLVGASVLTLAGMTEGVTVALSIAGSILLTYVSLKATHRRRLRANAQWARVVLDEVDDD